MSIRVMYVFLWKIKKRLSAYSLYFINRIKKWLRFWKTYLRYRALATPDWRPIFKNTMPYISEDEVSTPIDPVYYYQDTWAFSKIIELKPAYHIDIGSDSKFVAFLSKILPVTMIDIRPLSVRLESVGFISGTIIHLPFKDQSVISLSSLCVVEHIGLGRYGDPLDPNGSEKAIQELCRVLSPGGRLFLSVPVGDINVTAFNAGRIFSVDYLLSLLRPLIVVDHWFIVGKKMQKEYKSGHLFGTTGLWELTRS